MLKHGEYDDEFRRVTVEDAAAVIRQHSVKRAM
jgi:hypothetical protein